MKNLWTLNNIFILSQYSQNCIKSIFYFLAHRIITDRNLQKKKKRKKITMSRFSQSGP